jgi:hypothetical protein
MLYCQLRVRSPSSSGFLGLTFCFRSIASRLGTPFAIKPSHVILSQVAEGHSSTYPEPFLSQLRLVNVARKAVTALGDYEYSADGALPDCLPVVEALETELVGLSMRFRVTWPDFVEILYNAQLLQLYSFTLDRERLATQASRADVAFKSIFGKAQSACLRILILASKSDRSAYWPTYIKHAVFYGMAFGLPLANLDSQVSHQRFELLRRLRDCIPVMKSWSMFATDHWSRLSSHIAFLRNKIEQADRGQPSTIKLAGSPIIKDRQTEQERSITPFVRSRMASNLMYDIVWTGKHESMREENARHQTTLRTDRGEHSFGTSEPTALNSSADLVDMVELNPALDDFTSSENWVGPPFLGFDIFADWQNLIDNG